MDQVTARRLAGQVGGIATTEARRRGRWGSALDPWVVVVGGLVLRDVPGQDGRTMGASQTSPVARCAGPTSPRSGVEGGVR